MSNEEVLRTESAGVIPLMRETNLRWKVFLIQHQGYKEYWSCPKGGLESVETPEKAAGRELKEETNLEIVCLLQKTPIIEEFSFIMNGQRIFKRVHYFIAEVKGVVILQSDELSDGRWFTLPEAVKQVAHPEGKKTLQKVEQILSFE